MRHLGAGLDGSSARLIKVTQAVQLTGNVPVETGKELVRQARAVRLFAESREFKAATGVLDNMHEYVGDDPEYAELQSLLHRHTDAIRVQLVREGIN